MKSDKPRVIMIAAKSTLMRNALWSFLRATLPHQAIAFADQVETALQTLGEEEPILAILDADLGEAGIQSLIQSIRAEQPGVRLIALVDSRRQQQSCLDLGTNHALLKGFLDDELRNAVMDALKDSQEVEQDNRT